MQSEYIKILSKRKGVCPILGRFIKICHRERSPSLVHKFPLRGHTHNVKERMYTSMMPL